MNGKSWDVCRPYLTIPILPPPVRNRTPNGLSTPNLPVTTPSIPPTWWVALKQTPRVGNINAVLLERILVNLTRLETVHLIILLPTVIVLNLTLPVFRRNLEIIIGHLPEIPVVKPRNLTTRLPSRYMPTVVLESMQDGWTRTGKLIPVTKVLTLLTSANLV